MMMHSYFVPRDNILQPESPMFPGGGEGSCSKALTTVDNYASLLPVLSILPVGFDIEISQAKCLA